MGYWQGKQVFITGCTGLLGSWLTAVLCRQGANVLGLIHNDPAQSLLAYMGLIDQIDTVEGDIRDFELIQNILTHHKIDTIFHLAAQTQVGIANHDPITTFETNIKGTWILLEASRQSDHMECVIVASSDKAYGAQPELPYREDAPLLAQHPYDVSKSCADLLARTYAYSYGLPVAVTRCSNLYGGGDLNWRRIVPGTIRSVLEGERPVVRSDGLAKRNYIYVRDAVDGYLTLAEQIHHPDIRGEAFNFGSQTATTALDMIEAIVDLSTNSHLTPIILNEAKNEIQEQNLSSEKANQLLNWQAQHSLKQGLQETIAWYETYLERLED